MNQPRRWATLLAILALFTGFAVCLAAPRRDRCQQPLNQPTWCQPHPTPDTNLPRR